MMLFYTSLKSKRIQEDTVNFANLFPYFCKFRRYNIQLLGIMAPELKN